MTRVTPGLFNGHDIAPFPTPKELQQAWALQHPLCHHLVREHVRFHLFPDFSVKTSVDNAPKSSRSETELSANLGLSRWIGAVDEFFYIPYGRWNTY